MVSDTGTSLVHSPSLLCLPWDTSVGPSRPIETPWSSPPEELGVKLEGGTGNGDSMVIHQPSLACDAFNAPPGVALSPLTTVHQVTIQECSGERGPRRRGCLAKFTGQNQVGTQASELAALELTDPVASQTWSPPAHEYALGQRPNRGWIFIPSPGPHRPGFDRVSLLPSWWPPHPAEPGVLVSPPFSRICSLAFLLGVDLCHKLYLYFPLANPNSGHSPWPLFCSPGVTENVKKQQFEIWCKIQKANNLLYRVNNQKP